MQVFSKHFRGSPNRWTTLREAIFLVGENSTGKSSFSKLLKIIWSSEFQFANSPILAKYSTNDFGDYLSKLSAKKNTERMFSIGFIEISDQEESEGFIGKIATYEEDNGDIVLNSLTVLEKFQLTNLKYKKGEMFKRTKKLKKNCKKENVSKLVEKFHFEEVGGLVHIDLKGNGRPPESLWSVFIQFSPNEIEFGKEFKLSHKLLTGTGNINHFGPIRSKPERVYFVGPERFDPEGLASLGKLKKSMSDLDFEKAMSKFGKDSGLYEKLSVVDLTSQLGRKAFAIKFLKGGVSFYADELGFGISQIMPIIIEVLRTQSRSLIIIEQPELHLHPKAQAAFGDLLMKFCVLGHRFVVETHSDFIIDRFRVMVSECNEVKFQSKVLFFRGTKTSDKTNLLSEIIISENGDLENPPSNYRNFFLKEQFRVFDVA